MGITDNLFQRRSLTHVKTSPKVAVNGSQQYRLSASFSRKNNYNDNAENSRVTRFVVERDGSGSTLIGSSVSASLPDLSRTNDERRMSYPKCVCYRNACYIACDQFNCHFTGIGRVRTRCPCHPTVTFLLDLPQCPRCLGPIKEYPDRVIPDEDDDEDL